MNLLKGDPFYVHFHRKDAENAEDLIYFFCFPLRGRKAKISNPWSLNLRL